LSSHRSRSPERTKFHGGEITAEFIKKGNRPMDLQDTSYAIIEVDDTSKILSIDCAFCGKLIPVQYAELQTVKGRTRKLLPGTKIGYCSNCDSHKTVVIREYFAEKTAERRLKQEE
jgi:hypothetical protein